MGSALLPFDVVVVPRVQGEADALNAIGDYNYHTYRRIINRNMLDAAAHPMVSLSQLL